jgi:hypothetical protein
MSFEKGQSGNPAGRPVGIRDKRAAMRDLLVPHAEELVAKAVELALAGDSTTLRICIDRLIPPVKAKDDPVTLPALSDSLAANDRSVIEALADGRLTPEEAGAVMQAMATQARIVEIDDIEKRVTALEQAGKSNLPYSYPQRDKKTAYLPTTIPRIASTLGEARAPSCELRRERKRALWVSVVRRRCRPLRPFGFARSGHPGRERLRHAPQRGAQIVDPPR